MVVFDKECETKAAKKSKRRIELSHNNNRLPTEFCLATSHTYFLRRYGFTFAYIDPMDADQVNYIFFLIGNVSYGARFSLQILWMAPEI